MHFLYLLSMLDKSAKICYNSIATKGELVWQAERAFTAPTHNLMRVMPP